MENVLNGTYAGHMEGMHRENFRIVECGMIDLGVNIGMYLMYNVYIMYTVTRSVTYFGELQDL